MSNVMEAVLSREFSYAQPWFYNHKLAMRCELGIGDDDYMKNALRRAKEIYGILFDGQPDAFFFHHYISDCDWDAGETDISACLRIERYILKYSLDMQAKYPHRVVRDITFDRENNEEIARINRILCYPDATYDPARQLRRQIFDLQDARISFVSEENECIFSIYDDRGCDIVFFTPEKYVEFYPKLEPYFLDWDREEMAKRLEACTAAE